MNFTKSFSKQVLEAGLALYEEDRTFLLSDTWKLARVVIYGKKQNTEATVDFLFAENRAPVVTSFCSCKKSQRPCCHMAAAFYSIYYESDFDHDLSIDEKDDKEMQHESLLPEEYEEEQFFDLRKALWDVSFTKKMVEKAHRMKEEKAVVLERVSVGKPKYYYDESNDTKVCYATGYVKENKSAISVSAAISRDEILELQCSYYKCNCSYYKNRYSDWVIVPCIHAAAFLLEWDEYLQNNELGDMTDQSGINAVNLFRSAYARKNSEHLSQSSLSQKISLEPRLVKESGQLRLSFKVGENKMYIIKNLKNFVSTYEEKGVLALGKNLSINFAIDSLNEKSEQWLKFFSDEINQELEHKATLESVSKRSWYREDVKSESMTSYLQLYGRRLDDFYEMIEGGSVNFTDKDAGLKERAVSIGYGAPKVEIEVNPLCQGKKPLGITVSGTMDNIISGLAYKYFFTDKKMMRVDEKSVERLSLLESIAQNGRIDFTLGKNNVAEFYYRMLPVIQKCATVTDNAAEQIESLLPDEVDIIFYLDAENGEVICRPEAKYNGVSFNITQRMYPMKKFESFRDKIREEEALDMAVDYFPNYDEKREILLADDDEEAVYHILESGVNALSRLGEVRCTDSFKNQNKHRKLKISVGVSVQSDIMNLDITSEDISPRELLDILDSYRKKKKYHRLKSGEFIDIDENSLRELSEMMEAMHISAKEFTKGKMKLPLYRALYLDKMLENSSNIEENRDKHFKSLVKDFKTVDDSDFEVPANLKKTLRKYQEYGYKWMRTLAANNFGGILADDMGLGKTLQVISVLNAYYEENKNAGCSLIVCPASLVYNWLAEFEKFAPDISVMAVTGTVSERQKIIAEYDNVKVLVTSYDLLKRDVAEYEGFEFEFEVIDEAQYIKTHTTAAAKSVKIVNAKHKLALTGTPIENRLSELWSIFDYLMPGFLYGYDTFKKELETPIVKYKDENATRKLKRMAAPFILRRLKHEVLTDLPEKMEEVRYARMEGEQQKLYDAQVVHMKEMLNSQSEEDFGKNRVKILAELTRIRQLCCDPSLFIDKYTGDSAKRNSCMELVQSAIEGGHKMLIFSQFTTMLELLAEDLQNAGIEFYTITGATSKEKRLSLVNSFNEDDVPVFLISLKAGGTGLNLTGADIVIHYDPWWNVAAQSQATDRAHRIGQTKVVSVYKLIAKGSIEEKILKMQQDKANLANEILSGETGGIVNMTKEDLLELFE